MRKPSNHIIDRVLNQSATKQEAQDVAEWFATTEGLDYLQKRMDKEYEEIFYPTAQNWQQSVFHSIEKKLHRRKSARIFMRVASIFIPLVILSGAIWYFSQKVDLFHHSPTEVVTTGKGEKLQLVFQDGTHVYLNPETTLRFPKKFAFFHRTVQLNGEAYFDVAKNPSRPFIIELDTTRIEVLGTSFNVKSYDDENEIKITLDTGKIAFRVQGNSSQLTAGQQLLYNKTNGKVTIIAQTQKIPYDKARDNIIVFTDDDLPTVIKKLNRWYDTPFMIRDSTVYGYTYTTSFKNTTLTDILEELQKITPVRFSLEKDTVFVSIKK